MDRQALPAVGPVWWFAALGSHRSVGQLISAIPPRSQLLAALRQPFGFGSTAIRSLISTLERDQPADLLLQGDQLRGVWELRWSSSSLPTFLVTPLLENLQVLLPEQKRGLNLVRPRGPLAQLSSLRVEASIEPEGKQRVNLRFERGGWVGPTFGGSQLKWFGSIRQGFPAWLDVTVLDQDLRICRGNAGTLFALLRRPDLDPLALIDNA